MSGCIEMVRSSAVSSKNEEHCSSGNIDQTRSSFGEKQCLGEKQSWNVVKSFDGGG